MRRIFRKKGLFIRITNSKQDQIRHCDYEVELFIKEKEYTLLIKKYKDLSQWIVFILYSPKNNFIFHVHTVHVINYGSIKLEILRYILNN